MIFEHLRLIDDAIPGDGAWNMAVDEVLLQTVKEPTLRVYGWSEPTVTFGYFEKVGEVRQQRPGLPLMRRWTGGGLVDHGADWTYSLVIPAGHRVAGVQRAESYCAIHRVLQGMLRRTYEIEAELADCAMTDGEGCFLRPVRGDLLLEGQKLAGAAQRRTKQGLLHQGSVQTMALKELNATQLASSFSDNVDVLPLSEAEKQRAQILVGSRYEQSSWLERF